jgi:RimJ/RimL family protein N-acetyltransferase
MSIPDANQIRDIPGQLLTLRRLTLSDAPLLWKSANDDTETIFRWYTHPVPTQEAMEAWVKKALEEEAVGQSIAFTTVVNATGEIAGSTRFMEIDRSHRRVQIGSTWLAPKFQRTGVNTEGKYLMLRTAFEDWKCRRVELRTDSNNAASRAAILSIGAKEEGTFRNHQIRHDGSTRHSVYFSIIEEEWPEVKQALERRMQKRIRAAV